MDLDWGWLFAFGRRGEVVSEPVVSHVSSDEVQQIISTGNTGQRTTEEIYTLPPSPTDHSFSLLPVYSSNCIIIAQASIS